MIKSICSMSHMEAAGHSSCACLRINPTTMHSDASDSQDTSALNTYNIYKLSTEYQIGVMLEKDPLHFTISMLNNNLSQRGRLSLQLDLRNHFFHIIFRQREINSDAFYCI